MLWLESAPRRASTSAAAIPLRQVPGAIFDGQAESFGDLAPKQREVAGLEEQHLVAGRECVHHGRFPGA